MGIRDDDEDFLPSSSSADYYESADHGKRKEFLRQMKKEMGSVAEAKAKEAELQSQLNLQQLKSDLVHDGAKDEETKRTEEEQAKEKSHAPTTKTLKQKQDALVEEASDKPDIDTMLERQEAEEEVSSEETQTEPG